MTSREVRILEPGISDIGAAAKIAWKHQFAASVFIEPPVIIGEGLGDVVAGAAGRIAVTHVASTEAGTHAIVSCTEGRAAYLHGEEAVEQAVGRLREYFNAKPDQLGVVTTRFAEEPLFVAHDPRQM